MPAGLFLDDIATMSAFVLSPAARKWLGHDTWALAWQVALIAAGIGIAWWLWQRIAQRIAAEPRADAAGFEAALRAGGAVTVPLVLWLWLLGSHAILSHVLNQPLPLLHSAGLLAGALALIRVGVAVLRRSFGGRQLKTWENTLTYTIWTILALHLIGWLPVIEDALDDYAVNFGKLRVSLLTVTSFLLSSAVLLLVALGLSNAIETRIMRSDELNLNIKIALRKLVTFVLLLVAVLAALVIAGIDITTLTVFSGALGVGLGLGLQRVVSNFVSGFVIAFEESLRPGDVVAVGQTVGVVQALNARYAVVRDGNGFDILIPNEELVTSRITSWSYQDRNVRVALPFVIARTQDAARTLRIAEEVGQRHPRVLHQPPPEAMMTGIDANGARLELGVWIADPETGVGRLRSQIYLDLLSALAAAGVALSQANSAAAASAAPADKADSP